LHHSAAGHLSSGLQGIQLSWSPLNTTWEAFGGRHWHTCTFIQHCSAVHRVTWQPSH
jgi:hypothetical protein